METNPLQPESDSTRSRLILFEDDHLLVVNKPAGWNTHAPSPYAGEGIYDWLRHREPRWATLAIIHRLDKETSGVLVFGKTHLANRSLTGQFARREIHKRYVLQTDRPVPAEILTAVTSIERAGERYVSRPARAGGERDRAETRFRVRDRTGADGRTLVEAEPVTGRTHQIRVHAAEHGFPIFGDTLYGGTDGPRVCLHAEALTLRHPATDEELRFTAPAEFEADALETLRAAILDPAQTDACRIVHGASDGWPGWYVERLGSYALSMSERPLAPDQLRRLQESSGIATVYHKRLDRHVRRATSSEASPQWVTPVLPAGAAPPPSLFEIRENGVRFELSLDEGYSVGLFLDQRDNRRRLLVNHVAAGFTLFPEGAAGRTVLNVFAYTCGFSVCAARAGARVTSLDLSRKYLEWGRRNFCLNALDPAGHDFIFGDAFNWLMRLAKKGRSFDAVLLDPPTFSQSKESGVFRAEKDYGGLVAAALPLLRRAGVLFASTNAASIEPGDFVATVEGAVADAGRRVVQSHYVPQPPDFPISREEPAYLKTLWLRVA